MNTVGQIERATQQRVVALFRERLGYTYLGDWRDRGGHNVEPDHLRAFLEAQGYESTLINRAIAELTRVAGDQASRAYDVNKNVYRLLRYGVDVKLHAGENYQRVRLIDWQHVARNHFAIAEEVTVQGPNAKRPDLVLYVNGIALGVLELKRSVVSVEEGIRQHLDNQKAVFIQPFYATVQLVLAGNDTQGLRYGTTATTEKYFLTWKEAGDAALDGLGVLDRHLAQLCRKERLLEMVHDFVVFDSGTKRLCRHNQYFGVKAAQQRLRRREGGIIWHTQGSGKSLTMVWLAKWLRENVQGSRVLVVTDRTELDEQIEEVFRGVDEEIYRTMSGRDLVRVLNQEEPWLVCSLIHKFGGRDEADVEGYVEELRNSLPPGFAPKGDLYVFVDECHRTQSGALHEAMKAILPGALFIGFTGTPLLSGDKPRTLEVFGPYIHTYKFNEAVPDKVVLDLRYEARDIDQRLTSPAKVDEWFAHKTEGLNDVAKARLKQRWGTMQKVLSSRSRLEKIVADILLDMEKLDRLSSGRGNAMLVVSSIYEACKVYELFTQSGFHTCAIVTSYRGDVASTKGEETGEGKTEKLHQHAIYQQMLGGKDPEAFEKEVKRRFVREPGQMKLLIVVDKLLTGFDAPPATYLYIDKTMRDHGLFQAICRVNRLDGEDKKYGYIIDYKDLFGSLEKAISDYTSDAFDRYDADDVRGLLTDRVAKGREALDDARDRLLNLCEPVPPPRSTEAYRRFFCGTDVADPDALKAREASRLSLYKFVAAFLRAYADLASDMAAAGYTQAEAQAIRADVEHFEKVRAEVKIASGDYKDLKVYEPAMRHLIDTYIQAEESEKLSTLDDKSLIHLLAEKGADALAHLPGGIQKSQHAIAETIENNLRRMILSERPLNPAYYDRMSALLDELIQKRREGAIEYRDYLKEVVERSRQAVSPGAPNGEGPRYPAGVDTPGKRSLYDNLGGDADRALAVHRAVQGAGQHGFRGDPIKERIVKGAIYRVVGVVEEAERLYQIIDKQKEY